MMTDPIADMLTRIRNAVIARHESTVMPASKMKVAMAKILKDEGFIKDYEVVRGQPQRVLKIHLAFRDRKQPVISGIQRISKPGLRVYSGAGQVPRVHGGIGIAIVSTSKGLLTGQQAWRQKMGGEVVCYVW
ncbi:MAG: 30S ribosomal protein S8 [Dehalococcoidia bacterium]|nr:30S ribosomal protein S8 [Dehalococcoidia bacterium]